MIKQAETELTISSNRLTAIFKSFDNGIVTLEIKGDESTYVLSIEGTFEIIDKYNKISIDPSNPSLGSGVNLRKLNGQLKTVILRQNGSATLKYSSATRVEIESSDEYEPWNITGSDGLKVVSTPDKHINIWSPPS